MSLFDFSEMPVNATEQHHHSIGYVQSVDNGKVFIQIDSGEKLQLLRIGSLMAIPAGSGRFIIAIVSRIWRHRPKEDKQMSESEGNFEDILTPIPENNGSLLTLLGSVRDRPEGPQFSRSMDDLPGIDEEVFLLADNNLNNFMNDFHGGYNLILTCSLNNSLMHVCYENDFDRGNISTRIIIVILCN